MEGLIVFGLIAWVIWFYGFRTREDRAAFREKVAENNKKLAQGGMGIIMRLIKRL